MPKKKKRWMILHPLYNCITRLTLLLFHIKSSVGAWSLSILFYIHHKSVFFHLVSNLKVDFHWKLDIANKYASKITFGRECW